MQQDLDEAGQIKNVAHRLKEAWELTNTNRATFPATCLICAHFKSYTHYQYIKIIRLRVFSGL